MVRALPSERTQYDITNDIMPCTITNESKNMEVDQWLIHRKWGSSTRLSGDFENQKFLPIDISSDRSEDASFSDSVKSINFAPEDTSSQRSSGSPEFLLGGHFSLAKGADYDKFFCSAAFVAGINLLYLIPRCPSIARDYAEFFKEVQSCASKSRDLNTSNLLTPAKCLVFSATDNKWHRGLIMRFFANSTRAEVLLVDKMALEIVYIDQLKRLTGPIASAPLKCIAVKIRGLKKRNSSEEDVIKCFQDLLGKKEFFVKVFKRFTDPIEVHLFEDETMLKYLYADLIESGCITIS